MVMEMTAKKMKTDTVKERMIYTLLPTTKMAEDWKQKAEAHGLSISKFVQMHVENSIAQDTEEDYVPREKLIKMNDELKEKISELEKDVRQKKLLIDRLDEDLRKFRAQTFLDRSEYDPRLIEYLKRNGKINGKDIFTTLGIDPRDSEMVLSIERQLDTLETFGIVRRNNTGWRWLE